ncbi:MAG: UDP-N-acetylmuramate dehydrogenase [Bacteroidales bacterium]|nr:UDP-N-acetylmuramate dehydrogenase [Bacteroidales bacterium]
MEQPLIRRNVSLQQYNTFGVVVTAAYFATIHTSDDLYALYDTGATAEHTLLIVGKGSNILFTQDFHGLVLHNRIEGIRMIEKTGDEVILETGSGVEWDRFVGYCADHRYYDTENLSLIPGTTGAAAVQNIGAYGAEAADIILSVTGIDLHTGKKKTFPNKDCRFGYRHSLFKTPALRSFFITSVRFRLSLQPRMNLSYPQLARATEHISHPDLLDVREAVMRIRRSKLPDPAQTGNAGSFFKNPVVSKEKRETLLADYPDMPWHALPGDRFKIPAAWLIEQCGWKGKQTGPCATWHGQPLVIVNLGDATGKELLDFSRAIQKSVYKRFAVLLEPEVLIL